MNNNNKIKLKNNDLTKVNGGAVKLGGEISDYKYGIDDCFKRLIESTGYYMYLKLNGRNFNSSNLSYYCYKWEPGTLTIDSVQYVKSNRTIIEEAELDDLYTKIESLPPYIN